MHRVHVTQQTEVSLNGNNVVIKPDIYKVDDINFCKENDFMQCPKCKEWFDEVTCVTKYHPQFDERKQFDYCETCFNKKYVK